MPQLLQVVSHAPRWPHNVTGENANHIFPVWGSKLVRWAQSPALYRVGVKGGLSLTAVQVCYITIPGDIWI